MVQMIAYCGLLCTECPAYVATQTNDVVAIQQIADRWAKKYNRPITADLVWCDGCPTDDSRLCWYCAECKVRSCAIGRSVINCAHCDNYGCELLTSFLAEAPLAKSMLEEIRAQL